MPKLSLSFLWHMHQPNYRDPVQGYFTMPWVRLHAIKAYYDMASIAERYPGMNLTFNLVPSLLEQLEDYVQGAEDYELMLSKRDPADLTSEEKEAALTRFFLANLETMIKPYPRYMELLQRRGFKGTRTDIESALKKFSAQDYLDLQVLFNLAWFGFTALDEDYDLKKLIRKVRHYNIEDRDFILEKQREVLAKVVPLYRRLWEEGAVDISASPFYHPILPLLCDTSSAREGMPGCLLPKRQFRHPEDAVLQVRSGLDYFESKLGKRPLGMWPSEGSVSPAALDIIRDAGILWAATDEEILAKSVKDYVRNRDLYRPWTANGVAVFFRNRHLSDQIGFVYARNPASAAVDDFLAKLKAIASLGDCAPRHVSVILDGENPWETYPSSGKHFLDELYSRISAEKDICPVTFTRYLEENPPDSSLVSIFPGSWINGSFDTWMGDQEEVDAWDALKNARDALTANQELLSEEERNEAWLEIYRAEGSDWFWWYGEDHSSPNDPEFDRLFRAHLQRVYTILKTEPPQEVVEPILKKLTIRADVEPTGLISPVIDGRMTTFYEWLSAGWFQAGGPEGVMSGGKSIISSIYYGFDLESLYFRFDFIKTEEPLDLTPWSFSVFVQNDESYRLDVSLVSHDNFIIYRKTKDRWVRRSRKESIAHGKILEMSVSFSDLNMANGEKGFFTVIFYENGLERDRIPKAGSVTFTVPDENFQSRMWQL